MSRTSIPRRHSQTAKVGAPVFTSNRLLAFLATQAPTVLLHFERVSLDLGKACIRLDKKFGTPIFLKAARFRLFTRSKTAQASNWE